MWKPDTIARMIAILRAEMRRQDLTAADLAQRLGISEPTMWRWLRNQGLTVEGLNMICAILDIHMADLFETPHAELETQFTERQERLLAADRALSLIFFTILHGAQRQDLIDDLTLRPEDVEQHLQRLIRIGLIRITAAGRLRPLTTQAVRWRPDGPLATAFEQSVRGNFLNMDGAADVRYVSHMLKLSETARERVHKLMDALYSDALRIAEEDAAARHAVRHWSALFMLIRPLPHEIMRQWVRAAAPTGRSEPSRVQERSLLE